MPASQFGDPIRPAIIGRRRQSEVAEALPQLGEKFRRLGDGLFGVERIGQAALAGRAGHELGYSLRARRG